MNHAFTIIELLVVVTIIVVLLALLTPAMDKAIYEAQLAVCGAQQKGVVAGLFAYAGENNRFYPSRKITRSLDDNDWTLYTRPNAIFDHTNVYSAQSGPNDDRDAIFSAIRPEMLLDPFVDPIDLESGPTLPNTFIFSPVALWFSARYKAYPEAGKGMYKFGDRLEWNGTRFNVLVGDWEVVVAESNLGTSTHPPEDKVMYPYRLQDQSDTDYVDLVGGEQGPYQFTLSRWQSPVNSTWQRGDVDYNFGYDDGSVRRIDGMWIGERGFAADDVDERMVKVPQALWNDGRWAGLAQWSHLPRQ